MSVRIRLARGGSKKRPFHKIVVADSRAPRDGRFIEVVGLYHPIEKDDLKIDEEKALKWLQNGAQPTDTVKSLFTRVGIIEKFNALKKEAKATK